MAGFYSSARWKKKRENVLMRDNYLCQECRRYGKTNPAQTVHHSIPLEQRPDLKLDSKNLISLCYRCHELMHDRSTGELTALGETWARRAADG